MNALELTVEEENLISIYTYSSQQNLVEQIKGSLEWMDEEMRRLAVNTISKIEKMTASELASLIINAAEDA